MGTGKGASIIVKFYVEGVRGHDFGLKSYRRHFWRYVKELPKELLEYSEVSFSVFKCFLIDGGLVKRAVIDVPKLVREDYFK